MRKQALFISFLLLAAAIVSAEPNFAPDRVIVRFRSVPNQISAQGIEKTQFATVSPIINSSLQEINAISIRPIFKPNDNLIQNHVATADPKNQREINGLWDKFRRTLIVTLNPGADIPAVVEKLKRDPNVEYVTPDYTIDIFSTPNDPMFPEQWAFKNTGQSGSSVYYDPPYGRPGADIDAELAWNTTTGSRDTVVAVIDTGLNYNHEDIAGQVWTNPNELPNGRDDDGNNLIDDIHGWDFGMQDNDPMDDCEGLFSNPRGHGTHVSGIVGAMSNNNKGVAGVGGNLTIMPIKVAGVYCGISNAALINAILYSVIEQADVINMSLGSVFPIPNLEDAVNLAHLSGVVVVAAAGNYGAQVVVFPAYYPKTFAVAATNRTDGIASFSCYGPWVDVSAPGVMIKSTFDPEPYRSLSGTSMASPMVAGLAGLLRSQYPNLTPDEVEALIQSGSENIDEFNPEYIGLAGAGRINAARALMSITGVSPSQARRVRNVELTLSGISFLPGMTVSLIKTNEPVIEATDLVLNGSTSLTCLVNLRSAAAGTYDVVIQIGQTIRRLPGAFTVLDGGLVLDSIQPNKAPNTGNVNVTLQGRDFTNAMMAKLKLPGQTEVVGNNLLIHSPTSASVSFDLSARQGARWSVALERMSEVDVLPRGFVLTSNVFDVVRPSLTQNNVFTLSPQSGLQRVQWPAGMTSEEVELEMNAEPEFPPIESGEDAIRATGVGIDLIIAPTTTILQQQFTLSLGYRLSDLPNPGSEQTLIVGSYDASTHRWTALPSTVDRVSRTVSVSLNRAGLYQILQNSPGELALDAILPRKSPNTVVTRVSLVGSDFSTQMAAKLKLAGQSDLNGTNLVIQSPTSASVSFDLSSVKGARWTVDLTKGNQNVSLPRGFIVSSDIFDVVTPSLTEPGDFTLSPPSGLQSIHWPSGMTSEVVDLEMNAAPEFPSVEIGQAVLRPTDVGIELKAEPNTEVFHRRFGLSLRYRMSDVPDPNYPERLIIGYYDSRNRRWVRLPSVVDTVSQTVSASGELTGIYQILQYNPLGLVISSVNPRKAENTNYGWTRISGANFDRNIATTVKFQLKGQADITARNSWAENPFTLYCDFDARGAKGARWDVTVERGEESVTLPRRFIISSDIFDVVTPSLTENSVFTLQPIWGPQRIEWPFGMTTQEIDLELDASPDLPAVTANDIKGSGVGISLIIEPATVTLQKTFVLSLGYRLSDLPDPNNEQTLILGFYDETLQRWTRLPSTVDSNSKIVSALVTRPGRYQVLQTFSRGEISDTPSASVFPNPFRADRGHHNVTFGIQPGAHVRIYDITGRLIEDLSDDNNDGQVVWSVTNRSGENIASGIYPYLTIDPAGNEKKGRIGVIK